MQLDDSPWKGDNMSDAMRDYLEQREKTLEARVAELERENERLRAALTKSFGIGTSPGL
jgi:hypothetical protein